MAITSYDLTKSEKKKYKPSGSGSPYLSSDRVQLLSRVTEKKIMHKKTTDYISSFPLAVDLYKANSDDFNGMKKQKKKIKKSVLTLPNETPPPFQKCTVSEINDSEYCSQSNDKPRIKKRTAIKNVRKPRPKNKDYGIRDARYTSQLNINLNCSSADVFKNHKGDCKIMPNVLRQKALKTSCHSDTKESGYDVAPHDVWGILRSMNRFPFRPSPPISEGSVEAPKKKKKKKKVVKQRNNRGDTHTSVIETAEFAYISSYSVDNSSHTLSDSSSIDRITVINKRDEFSKICKAFEQRFLKTNYRTDSNCNKNIMKKSNAQKKKKTECKALEFIEPKNTMEAVTQEHDDLKPVTDSNSKCLQTTSNVDNATSINVCSQNIDNALPSFSNSNVNKNCIGSKGECNFESVPRHDSINSSKAEFAADDSNKNILRAKTINETVPLGRLPQLKGISRSIFRKGCKDNQSSTTLKKPEEQKVKKLSLVTAMPRECAMPKLSEFELKRKITSMRFPIVILGKDQIGPLYQGQGNYDPPHFDGLDKHIWPFMVEWYNLKPKTRKFEKDSSQLNGEKRKKAGNACVESNINKTKKQANEPAPKNHIKNKKYVEGTDYAQKNKIEHKKRLPVVISESNNKVQVKKQKPMAQLKDKMLNLLFQKLSDKTIVTDNFRPIITANNVRCESPIKQIDAFTEPHKRAQNLTVVAPKTKTLKSSIPQDTKYHRNGFGYPWAKAKWASDFIENVIKKVKNGVYYTQDKCSNSITESNKIKLTSDQDETYVIERDFSPKVTIKKKQSDPVQTIPGFDNSLPVFEIKTLNKNQISVKHCMSNVTMQFDVSFLVQTKKILMSPETSLSLIPIDVSGSQTKIFKCDTTILNAMLPAELCCILPKMMNQFETAMSSNLDSVTYPVSNPEVSNQLSTIAETPRLTEEPLHRSMSIFDLMSPNTKKLLRGMFSIKKDTTARVITPSFNYDSLVIELLPKMIFQYSDIIEYRIRRILPVVSDIKENKAVVLKESNAILPCLSANNDYNSSALQLYQSNNKRLVTTNKLCNFAATIRNILCNPKFNNKLNNLSANLNILDMKYDGNLLNIQLNITNNNGIDKNISVTISNLRFNTHQSNNNEHDHILQNQTALRSITCFENTSNTEFEKKCQNTKLKVLKIKKRKQYCKLYRKYKSMTNIPTPEKSTPINKIVTLDDFLQIIGCTKVVSGIFDDYSERKIISSIKEMKNWITEISAGQALLVLLLTNKKDTDNLVRFRPLILQGIAVNRITRASELDMEIEVIERENLNQILPQYEGISYLPETTANRDQLLEELYWIAKTTASDYQKPFDESSEKLLKSLLEKRKKLNPSYLRVMARYVGLGLLKSPAKK